jgi:hypothetical protein
VPEKTELTLTVTVLQFSPEIAPALSGMQYSWSRCRETLFVIVDARPQGALCGNLTQPEILLSHMCAWDWPVCNLQV